MNSESGRIANLLESSRDCARAEALAKARFLGSQRCKGKCGLDATATVLGPDVPRPSELLAKQMEACVGYLSPYTCVPESVRTARAASCTITASTAPGSATTRFSAYARVFPPACPPTEPFDRRVFDASGNVVSMYPALGGNISGRDAIPQMTVCALPNRPDFPVLPG